MVKHREGEMNRTLKQWKNSLQYTFFRHACRSRLELWDCMQAGCLQGGNYEFEHGGEAYSLNSLIRGAEDGLVNAVNLFSKLGDVHLHPVRGHHTHVMRCVLEVRRIRVLQSSVVCRVCASVRSS